MIETQVKKTLAKINLKKTEKILVALSGGKDSTVTAYLLHKLGYNIEGFHIDLKIGNYSDRCRKAVEELCLDLGIKLSVYDMKKEMGSGMCYLRTAIQSKKGKQGLKNCAICGVMKKWIMNKEARRLKADYIATGHHLDDEAQTFLMNVFKGSLELSSNVGAITKNISDKKFIPRIKPLFYVAEEEIRKYSAKVHRTLAFPSRSSGKRKRLPVVYDKCPCALDSYRIQIRKFTEKLTEKEKLNVVKNFERINIKKNKEGMKYCELCGEPSRKNVCKRCELLEK